MLLSFKLFHQFKQVKKSSTRIFEYSTMAHKAYKGHLLCAIPFPEPKPMLDHIRKCHPELRVSFFQTKLPQAGSLTSSLPADIWKDVTVLSTLYDFPADPKMAPMLDFIQLVSAGSDHMRNVSLFTDTQIPITTSSGIHGPIIGEWVIMTSLIGSHKYRILDEWQHARTWHDSPSGKANFASVSDNVGKRLGILGYGSIGRHVARMAKAMGMEIFAFTGNPRNTAESRRDYGYVVPGTGDPEGEIPSHWFSGFDKESLHQFLGQDLDHLLISVPLTEKTRHLLGKEEFQILSRKNAFITNISRGEILVQTDLVAALKDFENHDPNSQSDTGGLRGAALDVATPEPLPSDDPLWDAPNCIITPHMSGSNRHYSTRALQVLEKNLQRFANGQRLLNSVDRKIGYASKATES